MAGGNCGDGDGDGDRDGEGVRNEMVMRMGLRCRLYNMAVYHIISYHIMR